MNKKNVVYIHVCERCGKPVKNQEIGRAKIDGKPAHVKCTQDELDEIGFDDFHNY